MRTITACHIIILSFLLPSLLPSLPVPQIYVRIGTNNKPSSRLGGGGGGHLGSGSGIGGLIHQPQPHHGGLHAMGRPAGGGGGGGLGPMGTLAIKQEMGCADNNIGATTHGGGGGGFVDSSTGFATASSSSGNGDNGGNGSGNGGGSGVDYGDISLLQQLQNGTLL